MGLVSLGSIPLNFLSSKSSKSKDDNNSLSRFRFYCSVVRERFREYLHEKPKIGKKIPGKEIWEENTQNL